MRPWAQENKVGWGEAATPNRPPRARVVVGDPTVVGYDDSRTLSDSAWDEYAALSPGDQGQGPVSARQWRAETEWSAKVPVGLGEQPANACEAEWAALRRLAGIVRTGVTAWGWKHRDWDREDISRAAQGRMLWWLRQRKAWTKCFKLRYGREPSERATLDSTEAIRAERRNMRRCVRHAREAEAL